MRNMGQGAFWRWLTRAHRHQSVVITTGQCFHHGRMEDQDARLEEFFARLADLERRTGKMEDARKADVARDKIIVEATGLPIPPEVPDLFATSPMPAVPTSLTVIDGEGQGNGPRRQSA